MSLYFETASITASVSQRGEAQLWFTAQLGAGESATRTKVIPLHIVLTIKLASDGTIDKDKARCVVAGLRQTAGLGYDPQSTYTPMTEPTTLRLILSIANASSRHKDRLP